jgi:hypothetical protein
MKRECFSLVALVQSLKTLRSLALQVRFFLLFAEQDQKKKKLRDCFHLEGSRLYPEKHLRLALEG